MTDDDIHPENAAAIALMAEVSAFIGARQPSAGVALLALAKLVGQTCVFIDPHNPAELLDCSFHAARDEMRLRGLAWRLHVVGLGAIMPVRPA